MNYFDIIIGILLIIGAIRGFIKGFVSQLFGILALVVGIFAAIKFSSWAADKLVMWFHIQSELLPIISFLVVFGAIAVALILVGKLFDKVLETASLGIINRLAGSIFAILKTALIISVILWGVNFIDTKVRFLPDDAVNKSILYKPLSLLAPAVLPYLHLDDMPNDSSKAGSNAK
ncbi:MAG TPA: CvpA family protein [Williamwhitmania sp.]|nr:CvpA family protein [Williamwhitmania sp.]